MVIIIGKSNLNRLMFKIAIIGPESTGKSKLAKQLASHYKTLWVPEYARDYLEKTKGKYAEKNLVQILKGHVESENRMVSKANKFLFCDTDPLVIWIWSKVKYGRVDPQIEKALKSHKYDLYLLMYPDLPWVKDKFRESEGRLTELYNLYLNKLNALKFPFKVISGNGNNRLKTAINILKSFD
jgi:NadR type nicotinamide-nucleotide adenylyltransferase